jgi:hypothetical protein
LADATGTFGAGGAIGAVDALKQILMERIAAQERQRRAMVEDRNFGLQNKQLDLQTQLRGDQLAETRRMHDSEDARNKETAADRVFKENQSINESIPPDTFLEPSSPVVGRLQSIGAVKPQEERPAVDTGPLLPGDTGEAKKQGFLKLATAKQIDTRTDNARQADQIARERERDAETKRHNEKMESKPPALSTVTIQTVDAQGNPVTRVMPKSEAVGQEFKGRPNATSANRADSALAVKQTGEDIIRQLSDPAFRSAVGPTLGRYNTLRDFIGNPPPEYAQLAGQIESYALANMGVHGMRSAQGSVQIARLLDQRHTPESLIATIQGLNSFSQHFLENAGRGGTQPATGPTPAHPSAADLIKKYGGR